jgi:hypothetical protein
MQRTNMVAWTAVKSLHKPNHGRNRTDCNGLHRIVALEKVTGSISAGHPRIYRKAQRSLTVTGDCVSSRGDI